MTGGELVVRLLAALGVDVVFGVPGGQTLYILDAIQRVSGIRFVTARHESAAASMADAYGRLTGRPGVCLATTGPGATNLLTGVGGAFHDSSPVMVLTCNNFSRDFGRDDTQAADHEAIFRALTKRTWRVTEPAMIERVLTEAFLVATSGCPGPVLVDFARDSLESTLPGVDRGSPDLRRLLSARRQRVAGDRSQVAAAARMLAEAERPVLWAGNGVRLSEGTDAVLALAERLLVPVMTTFSSIGCLPLAHDLVLGPRSRMGTRFTAEVLREADLVVVIGNSLNGASTGRWTTPLPDTFIQIDIEPTRLGRDYARQTLGIIGDARTVIEQLLDETPGAAPGQAGRRQEWTGNLAKRKRSFYDEAAAMAATPPDGRCINPLAVVSSLRQAAPDETILVVDAGNAGVWTHLWEARRPGGYLKPVGFGNMGFGIPAGIAAKLVHPDVPVAVLVGDGSLGMTLGELETVARERTAICVVVLDDRGYGNIRHEQEWLFGQPGIGVDFAPFDYAQVARACGIAGYEVHDALGLSRLLADFFEAPRPTLIDARIDPAENAWTHPLLASP
jgi:acetolactate synthase I/II/III large subunit